MSQTKLKSDKELLDEARKLYTKYMNFNIIDAEHMFTAGFHELLSPYVKSTWQNGDEIIRGEINTFFIQASSTGKGVLQKTHQKILEESGKRAIILNDFSTAGIIGSINKEKNGNIVTTKPLNDFDWIAIDEASLITASKTTSKAEVIDTLNGYLDSKRINKMLSAGHLHYSGTSSITFGSYIEGTIQYTVLKKGFFQRLFVVYKEHTEVERKNIRMKMDALIQTNVTNQTQFDDAKNKLIAFLKNLESNKLICVVNKTDMNYFTKRFEELLDFIKQKHNIEKSDESLESCFTRSKKLAKSIMVQGATICNKDKISKDVVEYSLTAIFEHIDAFIRLHKKASEGTESGKKLFLAKSIIRAIVNNAPIPISRKSFLKITKNSVGIGAVTTDNALKELVADKSIKQTTLPDGTHLFGKVKK
jgi:hypothetical protein